MCVKVVTLNKQTKQDVLASHVFSKEGEFERLTSTRLRNEIVRRYRGFDL